VSGDGAADNDAGGRGRRLRSLFSLHGRIGPRRYLALGAALMALKFALDAAVVHALFVKPWQPWFYLLPLRWSDTYPDELPWQHLVFAAISLPFVWIGVALTVRRLRDARVATWHVIWFVLPLVNLILFGVLSLLPGKDEMDQTRASLGHDADEWLGHLGAERRRLAVIGWFTSIGVTLGLVSLATVLHLYGTGLFVAAPWLQGFVLGVFLCAPGPRSAWSVARAALTAELCVCGLLLALGIEGVACVIMAAPLVVPMGVLGALTARLLLRDRWDLPARLARQISALAILVGPALLLGENVMAPEPSTYAVTTRLVVHAPPEQVWQHVVAFPELPPPREFLFRAGIAWPQSAHIDGDGKGAVRHCTFNTGSFVEPIEVWDPPRLLKFGVIESPQPMIEWNPLWPRLDAAHLHGFFAARSGQFELVPLADGTTQLEGTTWYSHGLWPESYWRLWSDLLVHTIHRRVLEHVRALSEGRR